MSCGKTVQSIPVADFTLVGATTDPDGLIGPLLDRFRIVLHLDYYDHQELAQIVRQRCLAMGWEYEPELPDEIAQEGTPDPTNRHSSASKCPACARWPKVPSKSPSPICGWPVRSNESATWAWTTCSRSTCGCLEGRGSGSMSWPPPWGRYEGPDQDGRTLPPAVGLDRQNGCGD